MHLLKLNFTRIAFACLLLTVGFTSTASADTTFRIVIDDDNAPATGCSYSNTAGSFMGGRWMLVGSVGNDGLISQTDWRECDGTDFNTDLGSRPWAIGHDAQSSPSGLLDVLETSLPLGGRVGTFRLGFFSVNDLNTAEVDAVVTNQGGPITVVSPVILGTTDIPTLGTWGFLALALGLSAAGLLVLRKRRRGAGAVLGLLLVLAGAGVAWAAVITVDGDPADWGSVPPPPTSVMVPSSTNSPVNADIKEVRAVYDMDTLFFRIDANLVLTGPPTAVNDGYSATLNTPLSVAAAGVLANDVLNGAVIQSYGAVTGAEQTTIGAATPTSAGGSITLNADGSFTYNPPAGFVGSDTFKYIIQNSSGSAMATVTFTVGRADQTITFTSTAPVGATVGGPTYTVTATATSGLPVTFAIHATSSTVCTIAGSTVSFIGAGTCVITANQAGNAMYNPAPQVQQSVPVGQGSQTISFTSTAPVGATVGGPTYTVTATATSGLPVTLTIDASSSTVCTIAGSTVSFIGVGTCVINANQAGNADYAPAPQVQQSFPVGQGTQTISFTSTAPVGAMVGGPTYTVTATATSGLPVTLTIDASASTVCTLAGSTVSFIGIGTCVINANQPGNADYAPAPQVQQSFPVGQGTQTISFTSTAPVGVAVGGPPYTVTATATSGLPVTFTIDASASTVCTLAGSTVSFIGIGTCVINANQPGNADYAPAPQVQQSFPVGQGTQTISFTSTAPVGATVGGPTYTVTATATSGLPVTFTIDASASTVCTIAGSTVSFTGIGTCVINANQPGNVDYAPAPQVQQSFPVGQGTQTISFTSTAPVGATVGGPTYTVTATATSGLPVTFTIDGSASTVCTIAGSTVSFIGVGTCVINANQPGNADYTPAPQVQQSFPVGQGSQTISFTSTAPVGATVGGPTYTVTATATSGLPVTFTIDGSASTVCTIAGSTVSFIGVGTCVINANQAGNADYAPAPQVQQSIPVGQGSQTISFTSTAPVGATVGGPAYTVTATATSGLPVTFTIDASASTVCTIAGSTVSFIGVGTCVINANQPGNANYAPAPQVQQSVPVGQGSQTISFTSTAPVGAMVGGPTYTVTATATSGLPVTFTIDASASTVCTIAGSTVSFIGTGTCVINANQAGNANYAPAPQVQQSFPVAPGSQTINFTSTAPVGATVGGPAYTVTATATSGLPVTFTIDASASTVCTIAGSTVSFIGAGTCVINANQAGNANYTAAPQVQQSVPVGPGSQTISFTSTAPVGATVAGPTYTVTATATSGLPVTFTIDASASTVCTIAGSTVSFIGAGTCVINANQAGNANYTAAPQVQQSVLVVKQNQTINFTSTPPALATIGGPTYTVTAVASPSGLPVTFTIDGSASSVCTIAGSTVSFIGGGTCVINANQPGNTTYNPAPQVQQSFAVNHPPQLVMTPGFPKETFDTVGNTGFEFKTAQSLSPGIFVSGRLKNNFTDSDGPSPLSVVAIVAGATVNGGKVDVDVNGEFTFIPKAGDTLASDSFSYQVTDGAYTVTRTVTIGLRGRVWYVKNNDGGGTGVSNDPFDLLTAAQTASSPNDYIFVYFGNGLSTGQAGGIVLKNGQHLLGEHAGLVVRFSPAITFNGTPGTTSVTLITQPAPDACSGNPCQPLIDHTGAGGHAVSATDAIPARIAGLSLIGSANAIDITTNAAFGGSGSLTIENNAIDNTVRAGGAEGIDINAGGTGTVTLVVRDDSVTAATTGIDITRTGGTVTIAALTNLNVSGNTGGSGIVVTGPANFNSTSIGGSGPVSGGSTVIGASGNEVGGSGLVLGTVTGAIDFTDLDVFAGTGTGISVTGTGAYTGAAGTRFTVGAGVGIVSTVNGPGVSVNGATINLQLTTLTVNSSPTTGVSLVNVSDASVAPINAIFSAGSGSSIANATGTDFNVDGGNATITYSGSITNTAGRSVSVQNRTGDSVTFNTGTINDTGTGILVNANAAGAVTDFLGTLTLSTGANAAFTATTGGTLRVMGTANTITTTTGVALNVTSTTIGVGSGAPDTGLRFRSISAGTGAAGPTNGIVLNNTGTLGSLTVTGTGGAGSGGTIQDTSGHGISLTTTLSPSFDRMNIDDTGGSGITGTDITNVTITNCTISDSATALGTNESNIAFNTQAAGTENNIDGVVTITGNTLTNAYYHGIDIFNFNGTISDANLSNNTITSSTSTATSKGSGIRLVAFGSATTVGNVTKATIANNVISNFPSGAGIVAQGGNAGGAAGTFGVPGNAANIIAITGNRIAGNSPANRMGINAIQGVVNGSGQGNFNISNNGTVANPLTNVTGNVIVNSAIGDVTVTSTISNNFIVANHTAGVGGALGISVGADSVLPACTIGTTCDNPNFTLTINGNTISQTDAQGILARSVNNTGSMNLAVTNNTVAAPLSGFREGIQVHSGSSAGTGDTSVCLEITGNTSAGTGGADGIGLRKQGTNATVHSFAVDGMVATNSPGVETYVHGLNSSADGSLDADALGATLISATSGFSNCNFVP